MEKLEVTKAIAMVETHLKLWGEPDPAKRLMLLEKIYAENIQVTDPRVILNGYLEVSNFIGELLSNNSGFDFRITKPIEVHHNMAILFWQFGPTNEPNKISGKDIFTLKNGLISNLLIFVDGVTATINGLF